MTKSEIEYLRAKLPYGDGNNKIFGMENFGNTCYCNSILQCLYYTEKFRIHLISHHITEHDRKLNLYGIKNHTFTSKYELLVSKRTKDQQKQMNEDRSKGSRKGSIFGLKFNSGKDDQILFPENEIPNKENFIFELDNCPVLNNHQKVLISKDDDISNVQVMVTRPSQIVRDKEIEDKNDYSQSSSMLLNENSTNNLELRDDGIISSQSSYILVGIPYPETFLQNPINPFNQSPTSDQRKRLALINGPIINLDHSLQLPSEQSSDLALLYALKDLFECMVENNSNIGVVSPNFFIHKLKEKNYLFRQNNMHHDAHEFCNYLINEIIECVNKEDGYVTNWCNKLFQGIVTNETKCLSCENITSNEETFLDLAIDIPFNHNSTSLSHCLNNFSRLETLTHQNKFYCNSCSSLQEAVKTIKIKSLPEILVINLKRFKYDDKLDKMVKLFDSISYPLKLRLFNTTITTDGDSGFQLYELYSLVVHIGGGPMHGHYISLCKVKSGVWLLFDDETVEMVDESFVMKFFGNGPGLASAYILFYQKCEYLDPGEDTKLDFGFNIDQIYHGDEYVSNQSSTRSHQASTSSTGNKSSIISTKPSTHLSISRSVSSNHEEPNDFLESEVGPEKSLFKKNFQLDESPTITAGNIVSVPPTLNPSLPQFNVPKPSEPVLHGQGQVADKESREKESKEKELKDKKSWIGGLKRRELKMNDKDRKLSNASAKLDEKERRKSIFGFKRKS